MARPLDPRVLAGKLLHAGSKFAIHTGHAFLALTLPQRVFVVFLALVGAAVSAAFLAYSHRVFSLLQPLADGWRALPAGWLIVFAGSVATAFPPLMGYSTVVAISGFLYGFPGGWPVVAAGNVVGSALSLVLCRTVFSDYVHRLVGEDKRFIALGQVLRRDGLGMLTMIRFCPLPYSLSNGFLAQISSISPVAFALATALSSPKLLVHVFIGSRLALLSDKGDKMSARDKAVNYMSMAIGAIIGLTVGWLVYRRTMQRAKELAAEEPNEAGEQAEELLRDAGAFDDDDSGAIWNLGWHQDENQADMNGQQQEDAEAGRVKGKQLRQTDVAVGVGDDDISLWDTTPHDSSESNQGYRDFLAEEVEMMNRREIGK